MHSYLKRAESKKHEGASEAFKDAQNQMKSISETIKSKTASISQIKSDIEKSKSEALEAHRVEEECIKEQDALIPLEQDARQKVAELKSVLDSEKSQGSVLKAIMKAKETRQIEGIYGRMGDLGAIDGKVS
ncbi:structural maintenance of chromosomes protein 4-like [Trifolium medium]|uniref:Structural maintenance of chromosomes protein 4-like n=1 Tax=Trifolium medium TaxID=97028 RepID=A0A392M3H4_9FABA|nr:structural maintenance of chromosomes protein 4-like [Trifolium medium]